MIEQHLRARITGRRVIGGICVLPVASLCGAIGGFFFAHDSAARATVIRDASSPAGPAGSGITDRGQVILKTTDGHTLGIASRPDGTGCIVYDGDGASVCPPLGQTLTQQSTLVLSGMVKVDPATGAAKMLSAFGFAPPGAVAVDVVHRDGSVSKAEFSGGLFYATGSILPRGLSASAPSTTTGKCSPRNPFRSSCTRRTGGRCALGAGGFIKGSPALPGVLARAECRAWTRVEGWLVQKAHLWVDAKTPAKSRNRCEASRLAQVTGSSSSVWLAAAFL